MENMAEKNKAMAAALELQIARVGKADDEEAKGFVSEALNGTYRTSPAIGPDYIGMTRDSFLALMVLIYGDGK